VLFHGAPDNRHNARNNTDQQQSFHLDPTGDKIIVTITDG
jgi:hypothetical protein